MFEKDEDYRKARKESKDEITKVIKVWSAREETLHDEGFQKGAEFGYNKANEWHFVKDGDLPNTDTQNYTYIRRRKKYERHFTDYKVIKCFVLCLNDSGKTISEIGYFDCNKKCFLDKAEGFIYAWKEIVLPELPKESE